MFLRLCPGNNSNGGFAIALGLNNQTVAHVNGTVGLRSKSLVVSNNNESLSVTFAKFEKQLVKFLLVPCVETARRLIGKNNIGVVYKSTRHRHSLLLSARKLKRLVVFAVGKPHESEQLFRPRNGFCAFCFGYVCRDEHIFLGSKLI